MTVKLTKRQWDVLRDVRDGHVHRSEGSFDLYACYDRAQRNKKVTAIVERLAALDLVRIGEQDGMRRPWHVTEQGAEALAQKETP